MINNSTLKKKTIKKTDRKRLYRYDAIQNVRIFEKIWLGVTFETFETSENGIFNYKKFPKFPEIPKHFSRESQFQKRSYFPGNSQFREFPTKL